MGIKVKCKTTKNLLPKIVANLKEISRKKVEIGAFDGENAWLVGIHEYGCTITAKTSKYLTIPVHPKAKGKKAKDFPDLFFYEASSGEKFLVREKGKNGLEVLFWLTKSVKIPERSFLRAGHDTYIDEVLNSTKPMLEGVISGDISPEEYFNAIGHSLSSQIKKYAKDLSSPENSWATTEMKGSSNPLVDTGNMIESITWRTK